MSHRTRRVHPAALVVTAAVLLTGCGADGGVSEDEFAHGAGGVHADVGGVLLRDVSLDEPADGTYEPGDVARLRLTLLNESDTPDALLDVRTGAASARRILVDRGCDGDADVVGGVPLPSEPAARRPNPVPPDGPEVDYRVDVLIDEVLRSGSSVPVTFVFRDAGSTTVQVPVELTDTPVPTGDDPACEPAGDVS